MNKSNMQGMYHIDSIKTYLNYMEEHLENIAKAFNEVTSKCKDLWFVTDKNIFQKLIEDIKKHDVSKFYTEEFIPYQQKYFPVHNYNLSKNAYINAWEHHKKYNYHHHQTLKTDIDVVHMVIDWVAMSYVFGDTALKYYEKNKEKINLDKHQQYILYEIFDELYLDRN